VSAISHAVFLSYASQDAEAAQKICEALRAGGIEVFLDQSELRGGDAWDQKIRKEIHDCALFVPLISAHSDARHEGYFRREWRLAVERAGDMSERVAFLLPVVIDDTSDSGADVPDRFRAVQWTRLQAGETPPAFVERVQRLLSLEAATPTRAPASAKSGAASGIGTQAPTSGWPRRALPLAAAVLVLIAVAYMAIDKRWISKQPAASSTAANPTSSAFAPPPHSVAVLPFVNMSGDKEQEYFSDGLTEEVLNSLVEINELQVAARTSAFSFKGTNTDIGTIARKLNVSAVLEGSVRRSGHAVRVSTQLINAVTGFHLWSHTYDRDLTDVLKLETEIAHAVASALKVSLLGDVATRIELGGTRNPDAFDAYLRGSKILNFRADQNVAQTAIAAFTDAIRLDPTYALAFAGRSLAQAGYATEFATGRAIRESFDKALADARRALALAPELAEGYRALAYYYTLGSLDFTQASVAYDRALALAPGDARLLRDYGRFAVVMGRTDAGLAAAHHAVVLDPLNARSHQRLGQALIYAHRYDESVAALNDALALNPDEPGLYGERGLALYLLGDFHGARVTCESKSDHWASEWCLAVTYEKLGRHTDAEAAVAKLTASLGDAAAYQYATIYAQWGNRAKALEWLEAALRLRDTGFALLKTDPLMDPLRKEPRFQAIERELKFPT
jgi:TolB-like protein/Flp pilus assembly protein TadD